MVYGLAHVDRSGRVADRTVTGALGWRGGDRLTLTAEAGVVVIRRDPSGPVTLPPRSCVPIPAALRHRCGLLPGDPVLLTAVPAEDTLTAYSLAVVDQALRAHIPLGFTATSGLSALVTTTIGAAAGGNLALIAVSLVRERSARGHGNDPAATYAVAPAPGSLAPHAAHHGDARHGSAEGP